MTSARSATENAPHTANPALRRRGGGCRFRHHRGRRGQNGPPSQSSGDRDLERRASRPIHHRSDDRPERRRHPRRPSTGVVASIAPPFVDGALVVLGAWTHRGPDAAELPVAALRGGHHFFDVTRLSTHIGADRGGPGNDRVGQCAEPLDVDGHHIAGVHRARVGGRAREQDVAGHQGDRAGDVSNDVVHVPLHLLRVAVLFDLAVDDRADLLVVEVPIGDQPRPNRTQRVAALHPQHRAGVGVSEIVQAVVVRDAVAGDVRAGLGGRNVAARLADDDGDLALVVEPLAPVGAHDIGAMTGQRGDRLVEVRRCGRAAWS